MTITRKTVSLPKGLAREIDRIARKEKKSFSLVLAELADESVRHRKAFPQLLRALDAAGESGLPDLGSDSEKHLRELEDWD